MSCRSIDQDDRQTRGAHQSVVFDPVGGALIPDARVADPRGPNEDLKEVVEHRRGLVFHIQRAHDELAVSVPLRGKTEVPEVLAPGVIEVGQVAAVIDDALRVGVAEPDPGERGIAERRAAV